VTPEIAALVKRLQQPLVTKDSVIAAEVLKSQAAKIAELEEFIAKFLVIARRRREALDDLCVGVEVVLLDQKNITEEGEWIPHPDFDDPNVSELYTRWLAACKVLGDPVVMEANDERL